METKTKTFVTHLRNPGMMFFWVNPKKRCGFNHGFNHHPIVVKQWASHDLVHQHTTCFRRLPKRHSSIAALRALQRVPPASHPVAPFFLVFGLSRSRLCGVSPGVIMSVWGVWRATFRAAPCFWCPFLMLLRAPLVGVLLSGLLKL